MGTTATTTAREVQVADAIRAARFTCTIYSVPGSRRYLIRVDVPSLDERVFDLIEAVKDAGVRVSPGYTSKVTNVEILG